MPSWIHRAAPLLTMLLTVLVASMVPYGRASAGAPYGVWLMEGKAAVQVFDCNGLLCARILWLQTPQDSQGQPKRDINNPDPALRQRELCGLTMVKDLRATGPDRWDGGSFYNPETGKTYKVSTELTSADQLLARVYQGTTIVGETKSLRRVLHGTSAGWC